MKRQFKFAAGLVFAMNAHAFASTNCEIMQKFNCSHVAGCQVVQNTIHINFDPDSKTYSRCDKNGCDDLSAEFSISGDFINIAIPASGMLAKVSIDRTSFEEVVTLGSQVFVSFGLCK